jgi:hypothetical protein
VSKRNSLADEDIGRTKDDMTKFQLFTAFGNGTPIVVSGIQFKVIQQIEREDGSGHCFNVHGIAANEYNPEGKEFSVFVRTVD